MEHCILQVNLNQEDLNLLFRILAENLGEAPEDLNKVKPRIQDTGKRLTIGGIIQVIYSLVGEIDNKNEVNEYIFTTVICVTEKINKILLNEMTVFFQVKQTISCF